MCGIAGFFNYKTKHLVKESKLIAILESMRYRGPDDLGIFTDQDISIGNVRLAIQDISDKGNQPIYNEDKSVVVVYNGEIYNAPELRNILQQSGHSFYTSTDTEILVHLYEEFGIDMANDLNGMFAFALIDINNRKLLLGRDRTAQKPLYINRNNHGIFFSSELKSMLPYLESATLNPASVRTFLSMGYALEPNTILNEVETIEPGHIYTFNYDGERNKKFWEIKINQSENISDLNEWKKEANVIFKKAIKRHLLSDVPITLLLSGGIDSSLIALYLAEEGIIKKAYTGSFIDNVSHDEYSYAQKLGNYCGFEIHRVDLSSRTLADNLEAFLEGTSMPQGDNAGLASFCMAREVSKEFRVVLGGDGGDELFGGYPTYTFPYLSRKYAYIPKFIIMLAHRVTSSVTDRRKYLSLPFKLQQLSLAWGKEIMNAHFLLKDFLPDHIAESVLEKSFFKNSRSNKTNAQIVFQELYEKAMFEDPLKKLCWIDFNTFLRSATIPKVERNTMYFSLENRLPYLDNEMLDLSIRTASSLMIDKHNTKKCLKALLKEKTTDNIRLNPIKQGFNLPLVALFRKELRSWKDYWLNFKSPFFNNDLAKELFKFRSKGWDLHRLTWNICVLNDWCYRNKLL